MISGHEPGVTTTLDLPLPEVDGQLLWKQLSLYLEIYKHHFDLFVKGTVVYLALLGAIAGYIFRAEATLASQAALSLFATAISTLAFVGCLVSGRWVAELEAVIGRIAHSLRVEPFPFSGARMVVRVVEAMCALFLVASAISVWVTWR